MPLSHVICHMPIHCPTVAILRCRQNGDISEAGGRVIHSSDAPSHAATIDLPWAVLGHAKQFPHETAQSQLRHGSELMRPDVNIGIATLEENLDLCFAYTFHR